MQGWANQDGWPKKFLPKVVTCLFWQPEHKDWKLRMVAVGVAVTEIPNQEATQVEITGAFEGQVAPA